MKVFMKNDLYYTFAQEEVSRGFAKKEVLVEYGITDACFADSESEKKAIIETWKKDFLCPEIREENYYPNKWALVMIAKEDRSRKPHINQKVSIENRLRHALESMIQYEIFEYAPFRATVYDKTGLPILTEFPIWGEDEEEASKEIMKRGIIFLGEFDSVEAACA